MNEHTKIYLKSISLQTLVFGTMLAMTWGTETAFLPAVCWLIGTVVSTCLYLAYMGVGQDNEDEASR